MIFLQALQYFFYYVLSIHFIMYYNFITYYLLSIIHARARGTP